MERMARKNALRRILGDSYASEIKWFREIAARNGVPHMQLASLEWNVGPGKKFASLRLTPDQSALIQAEMMMQFMQGGLDMATFWPLFWDSEFGFRSFFDKKTGKLQQTNEIMKIFGTFQGNELIEYTASPAPEKIPSLAVRDAATGKMALCLLNKNDFTVEATVGGRLAARKKRVEVEQFRMSADRMSLEHAPICKTKAGSVSLAPFSLTFIYL